MTLDKMIMEEYELLFKHRIIFMDDDSMSDVKAEPDKRVKFRTTQDDRTPKEEIINRLFELLKNDVRLENERRTM